MEIVTVQKKVKKVQTSLSNKRGIKISEGLLVITVNPTFCSKEKQPLTALRVNLLYLRLLQKWGSDSKTYSKRLKCLPPVLSFSSDPIRCWNPLEHSQHGIIDFRRSRKEQWSPKILYLIMVSVGVLIVKVFLPRGIIGLLQRKKEMVNLNGTQLPIVRRFLGYLTHWCANNASQEIISSHQKEFG